ncbi:MAG TPA: efflux RND transporter permease subunit, partial [Cyclobacteriaceae bacterium]|nr:efflux RND transporter permease subunit [Cyclobacteriaceae bacterium]
MKSAWDKIIFRPIGVSTTLAGIVVIGILALVNIPVSLMPKVDIPTLTVQLKQPNASARQLDDNFVKPLHRQFLELTHLADIQCETRSEISTIKVQFEYGTNMEYALFEVNEKIDLAMAQLSREYARPTVIASNPS